MSWARFSILILACVLVVGAVVFATGSFGGKGGLTGGSAYEVSTAKATLVSFPQPSNVTDLARVDIDRVQAFLSGTALPVAPEPVPVAKTVNLPSLEPTPGPKVLDMETDADRLSRITKTWAYDSYRSIGGKVTGKFMDEAGPVKEFEAGVGDEHKGVRILNLNEKLAVVGIGTASETLKQSPYAHYFKNPQELINNPQLQSDPGFNAFAMERYMRLHGNEARKRAASYTPKPGERMPPMEPPSPEENEAAVKAYMEKYAKHYQEQSKNYVPAPGVSMPTPLGFVEEQMRIKEYYDKYVVPRLTPTPAQ